MRVYMEITGESEGRARAVAMYLELLLENRRGPLLEDAAVLPPDGGNDRPWNNEGPPC